MPTLYTLAGLDSSTKAEDFRVAVLNTTDFTATGSPISGSNVQSLGDVTITDDDPDFSDSQYVSDNNQFLTGNTMYGAMSGEGVEAEDRFTLSGSDGSTVKAYVITGTSITHDSSVFGFVTDGPIDPAVDYTWSYSQADNDYNPSVAYSELYTVCFARDTMIDTDQGEVAVQDLEVGMMVRTRDNGMQPIRWIGMTPVKDRAVRIKAGAMGNTRDLVVSPRHRMVLDGWQLQMLFDHDHALVTALELVNDDTIVRDAMTDVEYYHVMFDQHEVIYAEGAATESFHPDQASMGSMDAAARAEILALFPDLRDGNTRSETAPSLSVTQAAYVAKNMGDFVS